MITDYGFTFGPMEVRRLASNDGRDKRAKWWALAIDSPVGVVTVECDAKGRMTVNQTSKPEPAK